MAKRKQKPNGKKKPLTNAEKIALAVLIFDIIKWLAELLEKYL